MEPQTLAAFLLDRIAEDEASIPSNRARVTTPEGVVLYADLAAQRVLAECEAKRRIVELGDSEDADSPPYWSAIEDVLRALASVHADHPEFREEWA